jgi:outer membrane receptor protein involved in Fe transport
VTVTDNCQTFCTRSAATAPGDPTPRRTARAGMASLLLMLAAGTALAQPPGDVSKLSLDELLNVEVETVYGASRYLQKIAQAPSSVSIVTAEEIRLFGYRTLADVLRGVRGFHISNDRNYSYVGARGFARPGDYNTRVLLLVDGHVINNNVYNQALLGTEFPVDVDLIERVEVIRGPSSSLYGTSAFFGVINVVMRRGRDVAGAEAAAEIGSFGTYRVRAGYGAHTAHGVDWLVSATTYRSEGQTRFYVPEFDNPRQNNGVASHLDRDGADNVFARLAVGSITVQAAYGSRDKHVPTAAFGTIFNDSRFHTTDAQGYVDVRLERQIGGRTDLAVRLAFDSFRYHGDYPVDRGTLEAPLPVLNPDYAKGDWLTGELKLGRRLFGGHRLTVGADLRASLTQRQGTFDVEPYAVYLDDRRHLSNAGIYAQDDFALGRHLIISAGIRSDYYQTFGSTTNPRAAVIFSPTDSTVLKLMTGSAYRAPNTYELYYEVPGARPNRDLKPERIVTYEAVVEQRIGRRIRLAASAFRNSISGLITQSTDPADGALVFQNAGDVDARGIEAEFEARWANGARLTGAMTVQRAEQRPGRIGLTNSPPELGKLSLLLPLRARTLAGVEVQHVGRRRTLGGAEAAGYSVANVTIVDQRLFKQLEVTVGISNVFNRRYADPAAEEHVQDLIWQDGRRIRIGLVYRFRIGS